MSTTRLACLGLTAVLLAPSLVRAGEFDRLEGDVLAFATQGDGAKRHESLSTKDLEGLPAVLGDTRSALLVVKTGQGNYARLLVTPALRKPEDGANAPVPVLVLERFDTFEPGKSGSRLARGAGLLLFDGFQVDLDSGLVVPPGQGGDLEFRKDGDPTPKLKTLGKAAIFTLSRPPTTGPGPAGPSTGRAILPGDFSGRYRLFADGRWSGLLDLQVGADRQVTGRFRSEAKGTTYPVSGEVSAESPHKARFTVKFPQTEQDYDAYLWTEGKNVLAGSFTMRDRTYGFFAVREGTRLDPTD